MFSESLVGIPLPPRRAERAAAMELETKEAMIEKKLKTAEEFLLSRETNLSQELQALDEGWLGICFRKFFEMHLFPFPV